MDIQFSRVYKPKSKSPPLHVPHPLIPIGSRVGVEVEVEDCPNPPDLSPFWEMHHDGSLRNSGIEYVFSSPLAGAEIVKAVHMFDHAMVATKPDLSWRTSTHVHVDLRDMTVNQVKKLILAYLLFEDLLILCQGKHREDSNFCPAVSYAQFQLEVINGLLRSDPEVWHRASVGEKYSAINLKAMVTHGTIEFRGGSAMIKAGSLLRQVCRYLHLKKMAVESPTDEQFVPFINRLHATPITKLFGSSIPAPILRAGVDRTPGYYLALDAICLKGSVKPAKKSGSSDDQVYGVAEITSPQEVSRMVDRLAEDHMRRNLEASTPRGGLAAIPPPPFPSPLRSRITNPLEVWEIFDQSSSEEG